MGWISLVFSAALLSCGVPPALSGEHSLFYTYTALSKPLSLPGVYEFTALGMLDDRELDYYSSDTQAKVPKQNWMREKMPEDYWEKGTQSRRSKEQWFKVNVDILIDRMNHNKTDLHVLQWRHGCKVDKDTNGKITFLSGVDEYSYDGTEFLSFDDENSRWIAPVPAAEPTKKKWDDVAILNQYTKGYLEKECVDWLSKFMDYGQEEIKKHIPPEVHIFSKRSVRDPKLETLTCLATGFIPPDAKIHLKKSGTLLPDHLVLSTGIPVPNGDGTYQLRSHTDVVRDMTVVYECCVTQSALKEPIVKKWVFEEDSGSTVIIIGAAVAVVVLLLVILIVIFVLKKKGIICHSTGASEDKSLRGSSGSSSAESVKLNDSSGKESSDASSEQSKENLNEQNKSMLAANDEHV